MPWCCICTTEYNNPTEGYNHNKLFHSEAVKIKDSHITTCILCLFKHENSSIVKLHTELAHQARREKLFLTHNKSINVFEALVEQQQREAFNSSIKAFYSPNSNTQ